MRKPAAAAADDDKVEFQRTYHSFPGASGPERLHIWCCDTIPALSELS
jgi:hypothetical protein